MSCFFTTGFFIHTRERVHMKFSTKLLSALIFIVGSTTVNAQTDVNVLHLAPFADNEVATAVSVDVNGSEVLNPVTYNQVAGYLELSGAGVAPGNALIEVFAPPGSADPAAIEANVNLQADTQYTAAAVGDINNQGLSILLFEDDNSAPTSGNAKLRIVHAAPFANTLPATEVSIRDDNGTIINGLGNVPYGATSGYFEVPAATYDLQIATPDGTTTLIDIAPVALADGDIVTIFAIGEGNNQPLGVTAVFGDGSAAPLALEGTGVQETRALVAHFAPFASQLSQTAVSVEVNSDEVLTGVLFNQNSPYLTLGPAGVAPGVTALDVFAPPGTPPAAISAMPELAANTDYTVAAIGNVINQPLQLLPLVDDLSAPTLGATKIRIVHAAPFADTLPATEVSIRDDAGNVIAGLTNVPFGAESGFLEVPAGTYDLQIATPDGSTTLIDIAPVELTDGTIVTVFAVGDIVNQPLGVTAIFADGSSAALPLEQPTRALVAHLAPFDSNLANTAVSVNVNGGEALTGVQFNQSSGYLNLSASGEAPGVTQLDVFAPPGAANPAISASPDLAANADYTVAAVGNVVGQPLALLLLEDDNSQPAAGNIKIRVVHAAPFSDELTETAVSIRTDAGDIVGGLSNVEFGGSSDYLEIPAGEYDLQVATPDGSMSLINLAPVNLAEGTIVTVFAVGDGVRQGLGITAIFADGTQASLPLETNFIAEGFTDVTTLTDWIFDNRSDVPDVNWGQGNPAVFPANSGDSNSFIFSNFETTSGSTICNFAILPEESLVNGLEFWTRGPEGSTFPDRLRVVYSPTGGIGTSDCTNGFGDFTETLLTINENLAAGGYPQDWTEFNIKVPEGDGRIAFVYDVTDAGPLGNNSDYIGIDSVNILIGEDLDLIFKNGFE